MSDSVRFDSPSLRKLLRYILPTPSDIDAFSLDYFPEAMPLFATGQTGVDRENLLLQVADREQFVAALAKRNPRRFARYMRLLLSSRPEVSHRIKNPYRGLSAFQVEEADLFFGRDELTERLWQRLQALYEQAGSTRLLAVLGPSGSGKSSVARAGLLAELKTSPIPGPEPARSIVFKPGDSPLGALAVALLPPRQESATAAELSAQRDLADVLRKPNGRGNFDGLSLWAANRSGVEQSPFVVLVDQFEEVYTLCTDKNERDAFVGVLLHAAAARSRHVSVVLTLRTDFIGETGRQHPTLNRLFGTQSELVTAMSRDELRQVITEPATQAGQPFDDTTVQLLLGQAWGNEGTLPLLEFALTRIWEGMRAGQEPGETLREIGGVGGALADKAQEIFDKLNPTEQATAQRALVRLVRLGEGTRDTRRRAPISELCGRGETENHVLHVLREFASEYARLVTLSGDGAEPLAEVTHEALFDHWVALRAWIEHDRKDRGLYDRALDAAKLWQQAGRPSGRLWRPPDLDLLRDYRRRRPEDFGPLAAEFLGAAERRQKTAWALSLGAAATVLVALIAAAGVYLIKQRELTQQERQRTQEASTAKERIRQQLLSTYVERGRQLLVVEGKAVDALPWLNRAYGAGSTEAVLPYLIRDAMRQGAPMTTLIGHTDGLNDAAFNFDGRRIVTAGDDHMARVWDARSGRLLASLHGHTDEVFTAAFTSDDTRILTASRDGAVWIWDTETYAQKLKIKAHENRLNRAIFGPDWRSILTASADRTARLWDAESGHLKAVFQGHTDSVRDVAFSPNGRQIASASSDHTARVWDAAKGHQQVILKGHTDAVNKVAFSPDGTQIATISDDYTARLWNAHSGYLTAELRGHTDKVVDVDYSPDGKLIATASWDERVRIWDTQTGQLRIELSGHTDYLAGVKFSPDGNSIVTSGMDNLARRWSVRSGRVLSEFKGHTNSVFSARYSPDGKSIVTASQDNKACIWDASTGHTDLILTGHNDSVDYVTYSPDGRFILSVSRDLTARVWNAETGVHVFTLGGHAGLINSAGYSLNGRRIFTVDDEKKVRVWDGETGHLLATLHGRTAALSPDGRRIITVDESALLFDCETGRIVARIGETAVRIDRVAYSPNGRSIVTVDQDNIVRVWAAQTGQLTAQFRERSGGITSVSYSPDSGRIVTTSDDPSARIWDAETGRIVRELTGHRDRIEGAVFSPDGHFILTRSMDCTARIWETQTGRLLAELERDDWGVSSASFSPDGYRVVTAMSVFVLVWESRTGRLIASLGGRRPGAEHAVFSPDGRHIATAHDDRTLRIWDVSPETRTPEQLSGFLRFSWPMRFAREDSDVLMPASPSVR